jgi:hypothetical protein
MKHHAALTGDHCKLNKSYTQANVYASRPIVPYLDHTNDLPQMLVEFVRHMVPQVARWYGCAAPDTQVRARQRLAHAVAFHVRRHILE